MYVERLYQYRCLRCRHWCQEYHNPLEQKSFTLISWLKASPPRRCHLQVTSMIHCRPVEAASSWMISSCEAWDMVTFWLWSWYVMVKCHLSNLAGRITCRNVDHLLVVSPMTVIQQDMMRWAGPALSSSEVAAFERRAQCDRSVESWDCCHSPAGISNSEILWVFKGVILKHSNFRFDGYAQMVIICKMTCTGVRLLGPLWHIFDTFSALVEGFLVFSMDLVTVLPWSVAEYLWVSISMKIDEYIIFSVHPCQQSRFLESVRFIFPSFGSLIHDESSKVDVGMSKKSSSFRSF